MIFPERIFVTGTDTGVGKTLVSAILLAGLNGKYWKPVQSGLEDITDTWWIKEKTGLDDSHFFPETYRLRLPLSPHASAEADGIRIELDSFKVPQTRDRETLIIEGAGGLMVPLNEKEMMIDLIKRCDAPALVVARSALGTINHTLLSIGQLRSYGIGIAGVVMNGPKNSSNRDAIEGFGNVTVIAEIEEIKEINIRSLKNSFKDYFG
ncbi:MAG: dethiobiotin synthase [Deltaproteobacteria bacterium]|nr:dethiobiotin synthase [Deltaproteobacteria bacterium]